MAKEADLTDLNSSKKRIEEIMFSYIRNKATIINQRGFTNKGRITM